MYEEVNVSVEDFEYSPAEKQKQLELVQSLALKTWDYTFQELGKLIILMFDDLGLLRKKEESEPRIGVSEEKLCRFTLLVQKNYHDNPYHNYRHAVDVTQTVYVMIKRITESGSYLFSQIDKVLFSNDLMFF